MNMVEHAVHQVDAHIVPAELENEAGIPCLRMPSTIALIGRVAK